MDEETLHAPVGGQWGASGAGLPFSSFCNTGSHVTPVHPNPRGFTPPHECSPLTPRARPPWACCDSNDSHKGFSGLSHHLGCSLGYKTQATEVQVKQG